MRKHLLDKSFVFTAIFFALSIHLTFGQSTSTGMPFLNEYGSMQSMALGYATVAMHGYPGAAEINPASFGFNNVIQGSTFILDKKHTLFSRNYGISGYDLFQPYIDFRKGRWAVASYLSLLNIGHHSFTDQHGYVIQTAKSHQYSISLAGSYHYSPDFSIGLGLHYLSSNFGTPSVHVGNATGYTAHSFAIDLGLLYEKTFDIKSMIVHPSIGWSLKNFGSPLKYASDQSDPLPMNMQGGFGIRFISEQRAYHHPVYSFGLYASLSHLLARTDENGHPYGPFKALMKGWSPYNRGPFYVGSYPHVGFTDQFIPHYGAEVSLYGIVNFRIGYINHPMAINTYDYRSLGVGLNLKYLVIDYTTMSGGKYNYSSNRFLQITLHYPINH